MCAATSDPDDLGADIAIRPEGIIEAHKVRDWAVNRDVQNEIKMAMDDYLYEVKATYGLPLPLEDMDAILDQVVEIARHRDTL